MDTHMQALSLSLSLCAESWLLSVSGEAQYVNDLPTMPNEVYAAFCLTTVGQGYITNIDDSEIQVRYIVTKAQVGYLGTVVVYCCIRCEVLVRNALAMASSVNLKTFPVCCCIRCKILKLIECQHSSVHMYIPYSHYHGCLFVIVTAILICQAVREFA